RRRRRRHLYLVLDDWEKGYSIYRVAEDDFHSAPGVDARPAESPLVCIEAQHPFSCCFAAHGTKIFAMQPPESSPGVPVFDTETLGETVCHHPPSRGLVSISNKPVYASAGGSLMALVYFNVDVLGGPGDQPWSWSRVNEPAPFASNRVSCYALHPDGHTVLMSVRAWRPTTAETHPYYHGGRDSTFAFDTEARQWTYIGEWLLPFHGRAYYDRELDALVGVCHYKEGPGAMPSWRIGVEVFFHADSDHHMGATLVYMGDSRFCLLECRAGEDNDDSDRRLRVVEMTSFVLKYYEAGGLRTTHHRAFASMSYQAAHDRFQHAPDPVAFWM
ncbi:hypothetical protein SETIT_7G227200v2, partial [Setaria italica]